MRSDSGTSPLTPEQIIGLGYSVSAADAARILGVGLRTMQRLGKEGLYGAKKVGGQWRFSRRALLDEIGVDLETLAHDAAVLQAGGTAEPTADAAQTPVQGAGVPAMPWPWFPVPGMGVGMPPQMRAGA